MAVGRKPGENETMDPAKIIGAEFLVTVVDKEHGSGGGAYSRVESVRREPVADVEPVAKEPLLLCCSLVTDATDATGSPNVDSILPEKPSIAEFSVDEIPAKLLELENRWVKAPQRTEAEKALRIGLSLIHISEPT